MDEAAKGFSKGYGGAGDDPAGPSGPDADDQQKAMLIDKVPGETGADFRRNAAL